MRIIDLLTAIQTDFKAHFTSLKTCELHGGRFDLEEMKRFAGRAPAIYISVLGSPNISSSGNGERDVALTIVAFVVTTDRTGLSRFEAAVNLVESLLSHIPDNRWGQSGVFAPEQLSSRNFYNGSIDRKGVALWGVTWRQKLRLGECVFNADGVLPTETYLGLAPLVGSDHEDDYALISEPAQ